MIKQIDLRERLRQRFIHYECNYSSDETSKDCQIVILKNNIVNR